jgi:hypothetical protein
MKNFALGLFQRVVAVGVKECHVGQFEDVVATGFGTHVVSILNNQGVEYLLPIKPVFDYKTGEFGTLVVDGEFGSFETAEGCSVVGGFKVEGVRSVTITRADDDDPKWNFHHRTLRIFKNSGQSLSWLLRCVGAPE